MSILQRAIFSFFADRYGERFNSTNPERATIDHSTTIGLGLSLEENILFLDLMFKDRSHLHSERHGFDLALPDSLEKFQRKLIEHGIDLTLPNCLDKLPEVAHQ